MYEAEDKHPGHTGGNCGLSCDSHCPPRHVNRGGIKKEKAEDHSKVIEFADREINHGFWVCELQPDNQEGKVHIKAVSKAKPTLTKSREQRHALHSLRQGTKGKE